VKAISTTQGVVVSGTAIPSIAQHYCKSYGIPVGQGSPITYGRMKFIPKQGYVRVLDAKAGGTFIGVILPLGVVNE
jgi:hypothetical protein